MALKGRDTLSFLLLLGHSVAAIALSGVNNEPALNLECTNDFIDRMFCQLEPPNCSEYNLTLWSTSMEDGEKHCSFQQCDGGKCCCSVDHLKLIDGETHRATVWKGGNISGWKDISVEESIKPKTPEIVSANESNGNFEVMWKTHYEDKDAFRESLTAEVTYYEKGSTEKITEFNKTATLNGLDFYPIPRGRLKPSTTYMVRVRTFTDRSKKFSDSSKEQEFKTNASASHNSPLLAIIISLSVAAVILTAVIYGCYVKAKTKWWDTVGKYPDPDLLIFPSSKTEVFQVLKPVPPIISSISVDPHLSDDSKSCSKMPLKDTSSGSVQQSSGISTGSSGLSCTYTERVDITACVQDALCRAIPGISPISPLTTSPLADLKKDSGLISSPTSPCGFRADGMSSGSSDFDNKTYFIAIPRQNTADSSAVQIQAEIPCDSAYNPLCSNSSAISTTATCDVLSRAGARNEGSDKADRGVTNAKSEEVSICDKNPCSTGMSAESHSVLAVDDDYQAFSNLVEQPDALFSQQRNREQEESFTNIPQSFSSTVVPGIKNNVQSGKHLSELQTPFLSLVSAGQSLPVMIDSGYQCV